MKVTYIGPGKWATVSKDQTLYKFNPDCEVTDPVLLEMLEKDPNYEVEHSDKAIKKAAEKLLKPLEKAEGFPCPHCSFISKSKIGLSSHIRSKHKKVKK
jgi:predicted RNA-binding Zn-ribbon protein involved in translation (DUF1610 family)